jgi:autoinducer 2 (AI-2) kinase
MSVYFLSIDAGTSGGKVSIIDEKGTILGFAKSKWAHHYIITEDLEPYGHEFKPDLFWKLIIDNIKEAIGIAKIDPKDISAVSSTSQRHGCVFLNKAGKELYAGPNRDARGLEVDTEEYFDNKELFEITGHGLPFLFALTRLIWFRENEEEIYEKIKHLLTIDGWVNYRLTGEYSIDDTSAAETLLFDIKKRSWSEKILDSFEIPYEILPPKLEFAKPIGNILPEIAEIIGMKNDTPIIMSSADTQASLLGSGAFEKDSLGIVAGSTMPLQFIIDSPLIDPDQKIWTGAFINNLWVLESNAGSGGDVHQWFIDSTLRKLDVNNPYGKFEQLALSQPAGSRGVFADLGPQIFNAQNMLLIPNSGGFTFTPVAYSFDEPVDIGSFSRALVENLAYAVRANIEQIQEISKSTVKKVFLVGGLSRSKAFCQILANVINADINVFIPEGASLAGAIAGMVGTGYFKDYQDGIENIINDPTIFYCQENELREYNSLFPEWKELYNQSRNDD